mmetsp:Transcript_26886/g.68094  ORF Transcript_26886/g.68094 Transcript_26886/m.68094 type:complete len:249 (+) Transcript_26886:710-1456(+)
MAARTKSTPSAERAGWEVPTSTRHRAPSPALPHRPSSGGGASGRLHLRVPSAPSSASSTGVASGSEPAVHTSNSCEPRPGCAREQRTSAGSAWAQRNRPPSSSNAETVPLLGCPSASVHGSELATMLQPSLPSSKRAQPRARRGCRGPAPMHAHPLPAPSSARSQRTLARSERTLKARTSCVQLAARRSQLARMTMSPSSASRPSEPPTSEEAPDCVAGSEAFESAGGGSHAQSSRPSLWLSAASVPF